MAGTLTISTLSDGTNSTSATNAIQGSSRAWCNYNGSSQAIRGSYNISSVTRVGTGVYTFNFTNAMSNANYGASASVSSMPGVSDAMFISTDCNNSARAAPTTTTFTVTCFRFQGSVIDADYVRIAIFSS
jgi:hypothetical protein